MTKKVFISLVAATLALSSAVVLGACTTSSTSSSISSPPAPPSGEQEPHFKSATLGPLTFTENKDYIITGVNPTSMTIKTKHDPEAVSIFIENGSRVDAEKKAQGMASQFRGSELKTVDVGDKQWYVVEPKDEGFIAFHNPNDKEVLVMHTTHAKLEDLEDIFDRMEIDYNND